MCTKKNSFVGARKRIIIRNTDVNRRTKQKWIKTKGELVKAGRVMAIGISFIPKLTFAKVKTKVGGSTKLTKQVIGK